MNEENLKALKASLEGSLSWDETYRTIYATDASVYRKLPAAIALPKSVDDLKKLIQFAHDHKTSLIPRTAGTSLAGQCVGEGIVVDFSAHLTQVLEINTEEKWVRVQPGVVRDKLNQVLAPMGLFFPPETATANRAMIGGMVGNNSCGANSIVYGTTRDYVVEVKALLSDGSEAIFCSILPGDVIRKTGLEKKVYDHLLDELHQEEVIHEIRTQFPKKNIHRRNTGYAVDMVLNEMEKGHIDLTRLICGSEGTLVMVTELKLKLVDPPPPYNLMVVPHFNSIHECMKAVVAIMKHHPFACELMDRVILKCTDGHEVYRTYKFFVDGDPEGLLMVEFRGYNQEEIEKQALELIDDLKKQSFGYAWPIVRSPETKKVWDLRKAGLGLLANMEGKARAIECIEDTAVALEDLPAYVEEFAALMDAYGQKPLYYAHAGAGELHLRPVLDMHDPEGVKEFRAICEDSARLVKKYGGSLSGEHGDGRLRAEFIPLVMGQKNYDLFIRIKETWDPHYIFNPGKIVHAPRIDEDLRYTYEKSGSEPETQFDFTGQGGFYHAAARCSGSADCRKQASMGGTMCPSFMATRQEKDTTRARANALTAFYSDPSLSSVRDLESVKEILDLCLSCKGCHNECPSNVDMTMLKAEFTHQYRMKKGLSWRSRLFGEIDRINSAAGLMPAIANKIQNSSLLKKMMGIHPDRSLPGLSRYSLRQWARKFKPTASRTKQPVLFFIDEFTNRYDVQTGIKAILLLDRLGYPVYFAEHRSSGRAQFSKGLLPEAKALARWNLRVLSGFIPVHEVVGLEPSAILSFRDEYPKLFLGEEKIKAQTLADHCFTIEEFLYHELQKGNISEQHFDQTARSVLIHGHCHQKALSKMEYTSFLLGLPSGHSVSVIPSGCCGMAGSFGYEAEHYALSMQIGELVLFPAVRAAHPETRIVAAGTSCRHQILDGTARKAFHPVEILWEALKSSEPKDRKPVLSD